MVKQSNIVAVTILAAVLMVGPACASLTPMSWGFPTLTQNNTLTQLQTQFSNATDNEFSSISFPTTDTGVLDTTFPTITQTADKENVLSALAFENQLQTSTFAYPWLSIGGSPIASMGLL